MLLIMHPRASSLKKKKSLLKHGLAQNPKQKEGCWSGVLSAFIQTSVLPNANRCAAQSIMIASYLIDLN